MARDQRSALRSTPGKLRAAVRRWLDGGEVQDDTDEALASFGLVREEILDASGESFAVYAINWPTLNVFFSTWNQWHRAVVNNNIVRCGMDWAQVEAALKLNRVERPQWPMIFEGLRAMEDEALEYLKRD